jgi:integrase
MPRTARDANLGTRNARQKLSLRREPYWRTIHQGLALGYRKGARGGFWIARAYSPEKGRRFESMGVADDHADADGRTVFDFTQAQEAARRWSATLARLDAGELTEGPYTVDDALDTYLAAYERRGGKAADRMQATIKAHISPALGSIDLARLRRSQVENWFHGLAEKGARIRARRGKEAKHRAAPKTDDEKRRRRATANRCLTVLKAALNHAHHGRKVASNDAWATVKPFRNVDIPVVRYLSDDEAKRLANACGPEFRPLVQAALLTGCRYGELVSLQVRDINADAGTLAIRMSKSGKARYVTLTDEGRRLFAQATAGKDGAALVFTRDNGAAWGRSHQQRPLTAACKAAKIKPAVRFHDLRHTHGSTLAMNGVPLAVIAAQLGHADTRMTERHYAHLSPSYVAETIRASFPTLGIVPKASVSRLPRTG